MYSKYHAKEEEEEEEEKSCDRHRTDSESFLNLEGKLRETRDSYNEHNLGISQSQAVLFVEIHARIAR